MTSNNSTTAENETFHAAAENESAVDLDGAYDELAIDQLLEGEWEALFLDNTTELIGEGLFAVFLVTIVVAPIYLRTGRASEPAIILALLSGTLIPMLPGHLIGVAWGIFWLALAIGLIGLTRNFR